MDTTSERPEGKRLCLDCCGTGKVEHGWPDHPVRQLAKVTCPSCNGTTWVDDE